MAAPPVEGLKLQTKTTLKRVDELVHEYETTGSGRLRDTLRGSKLVFAPPPRDGLARCFLFFRREDEFCTA